MPAVQDMDGCVGVSMLVDRESGRCIVTTAWSSEDALQASRERVRELRSRAMSVMGAEQPEVREYEIAILHRERPVPDGARARVTWVKVAPSGIDRQIHVFRRRGRPAGRARAGFGCACVRVARATGRAAAAVTYESSAALEASREPTKAIRGGAVKEMGAEVLEVAEFDVALAHLRVPERV
jgi:hypothetical protein